MRSMIKLLGLFLACALAFAPVVSAEKKELVIGGKNYTEAYLLAEMGRALLEKGGFKIEVKTGVGSTLARQSLENGQFDLYYEYTGTAYTVYHHQKDPAVMNDPAKVYNWVKGKDAAKDLVWLEPITFNNTYTLMMKKDTAKELGIGSISDMAGYVKEHPKALTVGVDIEFYERPDGLKKLMKAYGFRLDRSQVKKMETGLTYKALRDDQLQIAMGFATDSRITAFGFVNLVDDLKFFPVYNPVPVVRKEVLEKYPEIRTILMALTNKLTTAEMQKLNAAVDIDHRNEREVVCEWLTAQGLL